MGTTEHTRSLWFVGNHAHVIVSADDSEGRVPVLEVSGGKGQIVAASRAPH
jgi:hypothetical protein